MRSVVLCRYLKAAPLAEDVVDEAAERLLETILL